MKLRIPCTQCFQELGKPTDEMMSVELRDDGLYSVTCQRGHMTITAVQEQQYEILFHVAGMALLDGYPREAVVSMAAALERFYEFYVHVTSLKHNVEGKTFTSIWKQVENHSERQFGAYLFVSLLDKPTVIPSTIEDEQPTLARVSRGQTRTWRAFRNAVVHKGYMPSTAECLAYGDIVYCHIGKLAHELKTSSGEYVQKVTVAHLSRAHDGGAGKQVATLSIPTLLSLTRAERPSVSLQEALKDLEKYRTWLHHK